jgi:DNA topoisomerase-1
LRYVIDDRPGITRRRKGNTFQYFRPTGARVKDAATLARIRSLAIPPAWQTVWISPLENGHLQATGRDARGRKQYRYHARWRSTRDESKYARLIAFAHALPKIRRRVARDIARPGLPREKVLAAVVSLLEKTLFRVGNDEYAEQNHSFGLTTMRDRHASVRGSTIHFHFRGKSGVERDLKLNSPQLARIVRRCQDLPGQELLQYVDESEKVCDIGSADVNEYLREISGEAITAKDFRTWAGTALAARALQEFEDFDSQAHAKRNITKAIERVAERLGNTKTVCRNCYVHPGVIDAYLDRSLLKLLKSRTEHELSHGLHRLDPEEAAVLTLLQQRMKRDLSKGAGLRRAQRAPRPATGRSSTTGRRSAGRRSRKSA